MTRWEYKIAYAYREQDLNALGADGREAVNVYVSMQGERIGKGDPNWPDCCAEYMVREQAGVELPV